MWLHEKNNSNDTHLLCTLAAHFAHIFRVSFFFSFLANIRMHSQCVKLLIKISVVFLGIAEMSKYN